MKYTTLTLFSEGALTGENNDTSAAAAQNSGEGIIPAAAETDDPKTRRAIYDEFIEAHKDFYTEDTQKMINRRFKEVKATESALKTALEKLEAYEKNRVTPIPPSDDFLASHPDFSLEHELENNTFRLLYEGGVPAADAYGAAHISELIESARKAGAQDAVKATLDSVRARGVRVRESASEAYTGNLVKRDVTRLTRNERAELARRALSGENITFN